MLLLSTVLFPIFAGILISARVKEERLRNRLYGAAFLVTDLLCFLLIRSGGELPLITLLPGVSFRFALDPLGICFLTATVLLYTAVTFYAFSYLEHDSRPALYFGCHFLSFGMMIALCLSGNLITMYLCFELVTLSTVPLVLHERTREAVAAGLKYLFYSIGGALMGLFAVFYISSYGGGDTAFQQGGFLLEQLNVASSGSSGISGTVLLMAVMAGIIGFGTKAGFYPMHGWLPTAHPVAPAPASSLLSGIIAKAGVLAIIRLTYYSVGPELIRGTWVQNVWSVLAMLTILMGSSMAFREKNMKKRLAWSTVSQLSYILLSLSFLTEGSLRGGLLHVLAHSMSKGCLFLTAGVFIHLLSIRDVDSLKALGKKLPLTFVSFTLASLSLVGIPPMGGFLSKWVIASEAIGTGRTPYSILAPVVLLISALLTAGYLLPVAVNAFFPGKDEKEPSSDEIREPLLMTVPMLFLSLAALLVGLFGNSFLVWIGFGQ